MPRYFRVRNKETGEETWCTEAGTPDNVVLVPIEDEDLLKELNGDTDSTMKTGAHPTTCFRHSYAQFIDKSNKNHTYSEVKHIDIDNQLVPVIKLCWSNNIRTNGCCQGGDKRKAFIRFRDYEAAVKFLGLLGHDSEITWSIGPVSDGEGWEQFAFGCAFPNSYIPNLQEKLAARTNRVDEGIRVCEEHNGQDH